jgi:hypothetical protein
VADQHFDNTLSPIPDNSGFYQETMVLSGRLIVPKNGYADTETACFKQPTEPMRKLWPQKTRPAVADVLAMMEQLGAIEYKTNN